MLKKILAVGLSLMMVFALTACGDNSDDGSSSGGSDDTSTTQERPFTESKGLIKYFTIENEKVCLPETVGEYVKYLEKIGSKVELGDTGKTVDEAGELDAGGISSMVAFLRVYIDGADDEWQWFGIRYENDTDKSLPIADCKVTQITLDYDTIMEEENHHCLDSIVFITQNDQKLPMDGDYRSSDLLDDIGGPSQNTDGHWHYSDDQGYKYEFVTENKKGILTRLAITYPE
ncbi:MAG: hypothetical protein ACLRT4_07020 [Thomasclavelia sp.]